MAAELADPLQLNRDLERGLLVLEAGTPLVTRVASSLQRRTNIPAIDNALALGPESGHVRSCALCCMLEDSMCCWPSRHLHPISRHSGLQRCACPGAPHWPLRRPASMPLHQ